MELPEIEQILGKGLPGYRARQIYDALYRQRVSAVEEISSLPQALRQEIAARYHPGFPGIASSWVSTDGTRRYLLTLEDGRTVETVYMPEDTRDTFCISSQVGCPVNCRFCLTALMGLERNLTAGEIVSQVLFLLREHKLNAASDEERSQVNVVMMGMGEPLLNLPNVLKATRLLTDAHGIGLSQRRITISTSGITPKLAELGREPVRPKLAISLNASSEEQRRELMPITRKYHLRDLLEACRAYPLRTWERLTFEYVLLGGVNDSDADASRVVRLLAHLKAKVNLIALNPGPGIPYQTPAPDRVHSFQAIVRRAMPCFIRKPRGRDIFAACGQLKRMEEGVTVAAIAPASVECSTSPSPTRHSPAR
jgi:23S rRNA (adenine2503-C2)-methyltransferase